MSGYGSNDLAVSWLGVVGDFKNGKCIIHDGNEVTVSSLGSGTGVLWCDSSAESLFDDVEGVVCCLWFMNLRI